MNYLIQRRNAGFVIRTILNSYGMIFFSNRVEFSLIILLVSFFNPFTGLAGLGATVVSAITAFFMGFSRDQVKTGYYTYSALLLGLGMGTFFELSPTFCILLTLASILALQLSAALINRLGKSKLPALSLAYILSLWVVILSAREFGTIGLTVRNIYWLNEMYATGGTDLIKFVQWTEDLPMPSGLSSFFRSVSAILFQSNLAGGILLTVALFFFSRIALSLMATGYVIAILFIQIMDGYTGSINYYNLGTNFMLVSVALGGFYIIPSPRSYLWSVVTVPISYVLVIAFWKITNTWGLPVYSLPFCVTVILFIYVLQLRQAGGRLVLTPVQYFSPEENLYRYRNTRDRIYSQQYFRLALPFMGEWTVSQGYDGQYTHKGEWAQALDFMVMNEEGKTWQGQGLKPEEFYCFNKPVLCPADAVVENVVSWVEDNPIGVNNVLQNWGNTIVLKHADGLYTKLSHLKKGSIKVTKGDYVKKGSILALCGNSGRSPEPHLHFQAQSTPYIDSRTMTYPISCFVEKDQEGNIGFRNFQIPKEGHRVSNFIFDPELQAAFRFEPGFHMRVISENQQEEWEVKVSAYNETYFYCQKKNCYAYFVNDGEVFLFTHYFGTKKSLLWLFYLSAYKILLAENPAIRVADTYPQSLFGNKFKQWLLDLVAPFYLFTTWKYDSHFNAEKNEISGSMVLQEFQRQKIIKSFRIQIKDHHIHEIWVESGKNKTLIKCEYSA